MNLPRLGLVVEKRYETGVVGHEGLDSCLHERSGNARIRGIAPPLLSTFTIVSVTMAESVDTAAVSPETGTFGPGFTI